VEFLPDDMEIEERRRRNQGLTRPELAVLLAYAKLSLYSDLLDSPVPDDPYLGRELGRYFPKALAARYPEALEKHRLRREIIATQLANSMINRGGPSLLVRMADETGASAAEIATAFAAVRDSYGMPALNDEINALDAKIPGDLQLQLYAAVQELLLDRVVWFLRNADLSKGLAGVVDHYRHGIAAIEAALPADVNATDAARAAVFRTRWHESLQTFRCWPQPPMWCWSPTAPASRLRMWHGPISPRGNFSVLTPSPTPRARSRCRTISTVSRSTARGTRSVRRRGGSRPRWSQPESPGRTRSRHGSARIPATSSVSATRSARSPTAD